MILSSVAFCDDQRPPGRVIPEIPILEPGSAGGLGLIDATSNAGVFARSCAETRAQTEQTMRRTPHAVLMRESYARPECRAIQAQPGIPGSQVVFVPARSRHAEGGTRPVARCAGRQ